MLTEKQRKRKLKLDEISKKNAYEQYKKDAGRKHERSSNKSQPKDERPSPFKEQQDEQKSQKEQKSQREGDRDEQELQEQEMKRLLGFTSFKSTKNRDHTNSAREGVLKNTQIRREYRQYKNRRGGMNRNLDKV